MPAPTPIQETPGSAATNTDLTKTETFGVAPSAGRTLVCLYASAAIDPEADLIGPDGWTQHVRRKPAGASTGAGLWTKVSDGSETNITAERAAGSTGYHAMKCWELPAGATVDKAVANADDTGAGTTSLALGPTGVVSSDEQWALGWVWHTTNKGGFVSATDGFTQEATLTSRLYIVEKTIAVAEDLNPTVTWTSNGAFAVGGIVTFRESAADQLGVYDGADWQQALSDVYDGAVWQPAISNVHDGSVWG